MRRGVAVVVLLASVRLAHAQAGPPMITNDPDTPGARTWEINLAATGAHARDGLDLDAPDLDVNRGVGERIQLSVHTAWAHAREAGAWRPGLGLRYRFLDAETEGVSLALQPLYVRGVSAAARRRGLAAANPEWVLPLQVARPFGAFSAGVEIARHFVARETDAWQGGVFVAHDCAGGDCLAEVNATRIDGGATRTTFNVGARHPLRRGLLLMGALGRAHGGGEAAATVFYLGLQFLHTSRDAP